MKLAIIDLGTNSVRFDLYEVVVKEQLVKTARLHRAKEMVRLGDQVFIDRRITSEAIERTISAFERFRNVTQKHGTDQVIAFGTCALRDAKNRKDLLDQLEDRTGFKVEVISGDQEAELIALGVLENENLPDDPFMLVDIGGGSTELTLCHGTVSYTHLTLPTSG